MAGNFAELPRVGEVVWWAGSAAFLAEGDVSLQVELPSRSPGVPEGAVNTTISFHYNARERSLTQEEVNARQLALSQELERRFGWKG